jgi:hypothetical protein
MSTLYYSLSLNTYSFLSKLDLIRVLCVMHCVWWEDGEIIAPKHVGAV